VPSWNDLLTEVQAAGSTHDLVRRKYLQALSKKTGRNTIVYYSGWLDKGALLDQFPEPFLVNDNDKNSFMSVIHGLDRDLGLDLVLHTPGGDIAAAESLVRYLRSMFGTNIRAVVPQLAMSAGTMISCACREIVMGLHSSLGPIDPQLGGRPAHGIVQEFKRATTDIKTNPATTPLWQAIISKYPPTLLGECEKAIKWSETVVQKWLETGMFKGSPKAKEKAEHVVSELGDPLLTLSHSRHIDFEAAKGIGLKVMPLEKDDGIQNAFLTVHHACMLTMSATSAVKLVENQNGVAVVQAANLGGA
jgi:ATP-dependent protease ClpP protease subunit